MQALSRNQGVGFQGGAVSTASKRASGNKERLHDALAPDIERVARFAPEGTFDQLLRRIGDVNAAGRPYVSIRLAVFTVSPQTS